MNDHGEDFPMGRLYPGSWLKRVLSPCVSDARKQYVNFVLNRLKLRRLKEKEVSELAIVCRFQVIYHVIHWLLMSRAFFRNRLVLGNLALIGIFKCSCVSLMRLKDTGSIQSWKFVSTGPLARSDLPSLGVQRTRVT